MTRIGRADLAADREAAAALLRAGKLVAFPTETVYGLGADATNGAAVAAIFAAKQRPAFNPLIAHLAAVDAVGEFAVWNDAARALAQAFWPGALTLVLPRRDDCAIALIASAGLDSV
ncbi:MAG: translation factor Sua5, partial [Rhodospirillaceae bacterium]|nr:translation factor Sua5 [Rhodospirillaceae bacterium]